MFYYIYIKQKMDGRVEQALSFETCSPIKGETTKKKKRIDLFISFCCIFPQYHKLYRLRHLQQLF